MNSGNLRLLLFVFSFSFFSLVISQPITCFPKQDKVKWGVAMEDEVYKKGTLIKVDKWVHKPTWDYVSVDTMRYGCAMGRTCDGFITYKNGLYGYAWCDGAKWENEFERLDLSNFVVKKKGKWGAFNEGVVLLPFEYDTLYYMRNIRLYAKVKYEAEFVKGNDTNYFYFVARKGNTWYSILSKQVRGTSNVSFVVVTSSEKTITPYDNGVIAFNGKKCNFIDLTNVRKPVFSQSYDSIMELSALYAVKSNSKWLLVHPNRPNFPNGKGWDSISATGHNSFMAVWENGLVGIIEYSNSYLKEVFKPFANGVELHVKKSNQVVFRFNENGNYKTYNEQAVLLSRFGDFSITSHLEAGPFWIEKNEDAASVIVYNKVTEEVLIPESKLSVTYLKDAVAGDILQILDRSFGLYRYGIYHYNSKVLIKPKYQEPLFSIGSSFFIVRCGLDSCQVFSKVNMQEMKLPFRVTSYKSQYQKILRDNNGLWHEAYEPYPVIENSKVILEKKNLLSYIEIEETMDNSVHVKKLNGVTMDKKINSMNWYAFERILELCIEGNCKEYYESNGKVLECNYKLPNGYSIIQRIIPNKPWIGESVIAPVALADSAGRLIVVNMSNGKIIRFNLILTEHEVNYEGKRLEGDGFEVCTIESCSHMVICGTRTRGCKACDALGHHTITVKDTIKGESSYKIVEGSKTVSSSESVWDPITNSYKWVKKESSVGTTDMVEIKAQEKIVDKQVVVRCKICNGTGKIIYGIRLIWDGVEYKVEYD